MEMEFQSEIVLRAPYVDWCKNTSYGVTRYEVKVIERYWDGINCREPWESPDRFFRDALSAIRNTYLADNKSNIGLDNVLGLISSLLWNFAIRESALSIKDKIPDDNTKQYLHLACFYTKDDIAEIKDWLHKYADKIPKDEKHDLEYFLGEPLSTPITS